MIDRKPTWRVVFGINVRLLYAVVQLGLGWVFWQLTSPEWWGLGISAFLGFAGGGILLITTLHQILTLVGKDRKLRRYERLGGKPRADRLAGEQDLKNEGLIR